MRELINAVERSVVLSRSEYLAEEELSLLFREKTAPLETTVTETAASATSPLEEVERETIVKTLEAVRGNKSEAARRLGITRRTLHLKLKKYGMM